MARKTIKISLILEDILKTVGENIKLARLRRENYDYYAFRKSRY